MRILTVCSTGLGSSFMIEMTIEEILKDWNVDGVSVSHTDLGSATSDLADFIFAGRDIAASMDHLENVIPLNNILDRTEIEEKLKVVLKENGLLS